MEEISTELKKVSVVIPCYNHGKYLKETIESVKNSTYKNIEIILVNDGSNDSETISIISELRSDNDIRTIEIENSGVVKARNLGISEAKGGYILPLDADDKIAPEYIEKAVKIIENNENIGIVYAEAEFFGNIKKKWNLKSATRLNMLIQNRIFPCALFKKEVFIRVGGYKPDMELGCEDWDLWLSIMDLGLKIYQIPEILFYYRICDNSRTKRSLSPMNYLKIRLNIIKFHKELYNSEGAKIYFLMGFMVIKIFFASFYKYITRKYE